MISKKADYPNTSQADYASVRNKVERKTSGFEVEDDVAIFSSQKQFDPAGNQNLSSVLAQIQDDGPAYTAASKPDNLVNLRDNKKNPYADQRQDDNAGTASSQADPEAELRQIIAASARGVSASGGKNTLIIQAFLVMVVISAVAFYLFKLDARTAQLEHALNLQQENTVQRAPLFKDESLSGMAEINKTLLDVKYELQKMKSDEKSSVTEQDSVIATSSGQEKTLAEPTAVDIKKEKVEGSLKDEIQLLRSELAVANEKILDLKTDVSVIEEVTPVAAPASAEAVVENVVINGWVVNLASFLVKERADKAAEKIVSTGFNPLIEVATVNGSKVYRLVVDGFQDHSEAEVFVALAADLYGLKGGWIRKVDNH